MGGTDRLPWFPCYPTKLLGALARMTPPEQLVYVTMLLRIYESGGGCADTLDAIAKHTGYNKRIVSDALNKLFEAGRLRRGPDGIHNPVADDVIGERRALRERHQSAGRKGGLRASEKTKENQSTNPSQATFSLEPGSSKLHLDLEEESKKESGSYAPAPEDVRTKLFRTGLTKLMAMTGQGQSAARSLIAKWLRDVGDEAVHVLGAIEEAERERVVEARSWITKALQKHQPGDENGGFRGRGREGGSISAAGKRLREKFISGELQIAPRPSLLPGPRDDDVWLLPEGRGQRP